MDQTKAEELVQRGIDGLAGPDPRTARRSQRRPERQAGDQPDPAVARKIIDVAFEHHLKQDLSGYPENIGSRQLNLCTMIVSIADVFDALRSTRPHLKGLATDRICSIMGELGNPAFNQPLLERFVNLIGLSPVGYLVRLNTDELAVVSAEHPTDPFRPHVKILTDQAGDQLEAPVLVDTWEPDGRGEHLRALVEAVDPERLGIDPLACL